MLTWTSKTSTGSWASMLPLGSVSAMRSGSLHCGTDDDECALGAGYGALDEDDALVGVDAVDLEVLRRHLLGAHVAGHPQTLEDTTRGGAATDRAGLAVVAVRAVRG